MVVAEAVLFWAGCFDLSIVATIIFTSAQSMDESLTTFEKLHEKNFALVAGSLVAIACFVGSFVAHYISIVPLPQ